MPLLPPGRRYSDAWYGLHTVWFPLLGLWHLVGRRLYLILLDFILWRFSIFTHVLVIIQHFIWI